MVAVAAHENWIRENICRVVDEEKAKSPDDIFYAQFDRFDGGCVANGHPTMEAHQKIANQIIDVINSTGRFAMP